MTHRRMWWITSQGALQGELSRCYHRVDRAKNLTACGIELGEAYGMFYSLADDAKAQRDKRCAACVTALKTRRAP